MQRSKHDHVAQREHEVWNAFGDMRSRLKSGYIEVRVKKVSMGNPWRTHAVDAANKALESVALKCAHCSLKWNVAALYQISQQLQND